MVTINRFDGKYRFLSNFFNAPVEYKGLHYLNNEAAFQAQKCMNEQEKIQFTTIPPNIAKRLGRKVKLRPDWEIIKINIMKEIVEAKFTQNEDLKELLLETGDSILIEGNTWNDVFWGINIKTGNGSNNLGKILMQVRED